MTQRELADKIGCSDKHVSAVERGSAEPTPDYLKSFSGALKIPESEILLREQSVTHRLAVPRIDHEQVVCWMAKALGEEKFLDLIRQATAERHPQIATMLVQTHAAIFPKEGPADR